MTSESVALLIDYKNTVSRIRNDFVYPQRFPDVDWCHVGWIVLSVSVCFAQLTAPSTLIADFVHF